MWTEEIVRDRFIEAAEIERRMAVKGMPTGGNGWPIYEREIEDLAGYDDQARRDHLEAWQGRKVTRAHELSRWEETYFEWTPLIVERDRFLVWRWAHCIASGQSFSGYCKHHGLVRMTAYNRIERAFTKLASLFAVEGRLLRGAQAVEALQRDGFQAPIAHTVETVAPARYAVIHPKSWQAEKSTDLLQTAEDFAAFEQYMTDVNEQRRKLQLRRAKAMRGVPSETEAA